MARRAPAPRRPNVPSPAPARAAAPQPRRPTPRASGPSSVSSAPLFDANADLSATYGHVKRDLTRILVIAVLLFAIIIGSRFIL